MRLSRRSRLYGAALVCVVALAGLALAQGSRTAPASALVDQAARQRPVGQTDRLIWDYQEKVRRDPANLDARTTLGAAYIQKARESGDPGYYARADAVLDEALRMDPASVEALIGKGSLALTRHHFREALALGQRARALNPHVPRIYGVIADAQIELGMYDDAVATIQTMVDMRPDLSSYSRVSYARELYGDLEGATAAMESAVRAGGPMSENTEWTRVQLGNLHFARGDLEGASRRYEESLVRLPDYVFALAGLARVRAAQGNTAQAVELYDAAIARVPLPEFVIALGELYEARGDRDAADRQYALVRAMQQLLASSGVDTDLELALFEADHGRDPQAALAMARAAYARRPSIKGADTLAWALYRAGQYPEARRRADEALRLGTQDALMLYHAGMIARAQGDGAAARDLLDRALALNPAFSPLYAPRARAALAELQIAARR